MSKYKRDMKEQIELGARICTHIKNIFYPARPWVEVHMLVADKFTDLKNIMRKAYPNRDTLDIVKELATYTQRDIEDAFG